MEGHAREAFPEECCGFLLGHVSEPRRVEEAKRAKNVAVADRTRRYEIDPLELLHADDDARARGLAPVWIYHSHPHPTAAPSAFELSRPSPWSAFVIVRVADGTATEPTAR